MIEPPVAGETRRIATVHIAVCEAATTSSTTCMLGAPPVPRMSRDASSIPAMTNGSSLADNRQPPWTAVSSSTAWPSRSTNRPQLAARDDLAVDGRGGAARARDLAIEQFGERRGRVEVAVLPLIVIFMRQPSRDGSGSG